MPVTGSELVIKNIKAFGGGFLKHVDKTMEGARKILDKEVTKNMSLQDHSLADLRELGHPYARRYGSQGLGLHEPYWLVHIQSGALLASKESGVIEASIEKGKLEAAAFVRLDEGQAWHALYIIWGTSKMIPRDFLRGSLENIKNEAIEHIQKNLRDAVISFRGEETH